MVSDIDIKTLNLIDSWNLFKVEINQNDNEYKLVRNGINIKFDINDYINNRIVIKNKSRKVVIYNKIYDLYDFETELENRERIIKKWLENNYLGDDLFKPRKIGDE